MPSVNGATTTRSNGATTPSVNGATTMRNNGAAAPSVNGGAPAEEAPRSHCPYCGAEVIGRNRVCLAHLVADPDWAAANRAMCDFVHRGITLDAPIVRSHIFGNIEEVEAPILAPAIEIV
jgi:predicted RNA-binding Zn-ribbon protein involved in translation (DUF1610 family)